MNLTIIFHPNGRIRARILCIGSTKMFAPITFGKQVQLFLAKIEYSLCWKSRSGNQSSIPVWTIAVWKGAHLLVSLLQPIKMTSIFPRPLFLVRQMTSRCAYYSDLDSVRESSWTPSSLCWKLRAFSFLNPRVQKGGPKLESLLEILYDPDWQCNNVGREKNWTTSLL